MNLANLIVPKIDATLINHKRIDSKKTIGYLVKNKLNNISDLGKILPICYLEGTNHGFYLHRKDYYFEENIEKVWNTYINIPPKLCWSGRCLRFSFSYDNENHQISYKDDHYDGLKANQLIFIEISILFGLIKLAVTHQINKVSKEDNLIKLCYVEGGKSSGSQMIHFEKSGSGTLVKHETYYKSDSKFRDKKLYPWIHEHIINHFHRNVKNFLK
jgi:hypothetical protein